MSARAPQPRLADASVTRASLARAGDTRILGPENTREQEAISAADHVLALPETALTSQDVGNSRVPETAPAPSGGGVPLSEGVRKFFEPRFQADFSEVRVHADARGDALAHTFHARAFAYGSDLYFASGAFDPVSTDGRRLLAHELAHTLQSGSETTVARSVDDWLHGSRNVRSMRDTEILGEIDELQQWMDSRIESSQETIRIEEVLVELRREATRREAAARPQRRSANRRRGAAAAAPPTERARRPRVLAERTSVAYTDPEEMRAEYDLVMEWLRYPDLSSADRQILEAERANIQPLLQRDRARVVGERRAARVQMAFTPGDMNVAAALEHSARVVELLSQDPQDPNIFYIYDNHERIPISHEQAEGVRAEVRRQLTRARQRLENDVEYYWERYNSQKEINDDTFLIDDIAGFLGGVRDPGGELMIRRRMARNSIRRINEQLEQGNLSRAAALLPELERNKEVIRRVARAYYEGYIEGAELAVTVLEITRDASFAIAGSIAAVVAAPVVAGAGAGLGLTGAGATAFTIVGTGTVVGSGTAVVRGGSAGIGTAAAGGSRDEILSAMWSEGKQGFREGFMSGAGGAAARALGPALGVGSNLGAQALRRVAAGAIIDGTSTMVDALISGKSPKEAVDAGLRAAALSVPGSLLGGSNSRVTRLLVAPLTSGATAYSGVIFSGGSREEAMRAAAISVTTNLAMSGRVLDPETEANLTARGRSAGERVRSTVRPSAQATATPPTTVPPALPRTPMPDESATSNTQRVSRPEADTSPAQRTETPEATTPPVQRTETPETGTPPAERTATPEPEVAPAQHRIDTPEADAPVTQRAAPEAESQAQPPAKAPEDQQAAARHADQPDQPATTRRPEPADTDEAFRQIGEELKTTPLQARTGSNAQQIRDAAQDARAAGFVDSTGLPLGVDAATQPHGNASDVRGALGVTGGQRQSAHVGATTLLRTIFGYSRRAANTVLLDPAMHRSFDQHWLRWAVNRRRAMQAFGVANPTAPLHDVLEAQRQAIRQIQNMPPRQRATLEWMLELEIRNLAGTLPDGMNTEVPLPRLWE